MGSSQSIAFPVTLLNAAVADGLSEITEALKAEMKKTKSVDDAVLKVVKESFKETTAVRFEGNNYSEEWVKEAEKRGLPNLRRTPEALAQLVTKQSRSLLTKLGVFTKEELESRYHVRMERYVKDMLIEMYTLQQMVDTLVLPAAFDLRGSARDECGASQGRRHQERSPGGCGERGRQRSSRSCGQNGRSWSRSSRRPSTCTTTWTSVRSC